MKDKAVLLASIINIYSQLEGGDRKGVDGYIDARANQTEDVSRSVASRSISLSSAISHDSK